MSVWSSDVCTSDLGGPGFGSLNRLQFAKRRQRILTDSPRFCGAKGKICAIGPIVISRMRGAAAQLVLAQLLSVAKIFCRSEEHTSELQSLMRISYAVFCLKKKMKNDSKSIIMREYES